LKETFTQLIKNRSKLFLIASGVFYLISLTQNCFHINSEGDYPGYSVLFYGFLGSFNGGVGITWWANIMIVMAWLYFQKRISLYLSFAALALGISFLFFKKIFVGFGPEKYGQITDYDLGYYLWIISFLIMTIGNILDLKKYS